MKPFTPKTELPPSTHLRKSVFGGSPEKATLLLFSVAVLLAEGLQAQETKLFDAAGQDSDKFGSSVAISGNTAIVGAQSATIARQGAAYIYIQSGNTWTLQQRILASDGAGGNGFGWSVDIKGDTAVVAARGAGNFGNGAVYVFTRTGTVWTQQQKLIASDSTDLFFFGSAVALGSDTLVVGSPNADVMGTQGANKGAAYIFTRSGNVWTERQKIFASDFSASRNFGWSVAISGNTVLVGESPNISSSGTRLAAAYFFAGDGTNWTQQQEITASDGTIGDGFSWSVAINGDTAIIGALPANNLGFAYVFTRSGTNWSQQKKLIPSDGATNKGFGSSISMSGNAALIGASADTIGQGSAYLFAGSGTNWTEQQKFIPSDRSTNGRANDRFGNSVGISGNTSIVGSYLADVGFNTDQGTAYIFVPLRPFLNLRRSANTNIVLSWATNFTGFTLEANTNLNTNVWSVVSPAPAVSGTNIVVTNSVSGVARFYRLRK